MTSSGGTDRSNRVQNERQPLKTESSSVVVERDLQSSTNAHELGIHSSADHLSDEKDLDVPALEQSELSPTQCSRDYYLSGLTMRNPEIPLNERMRDAPKESADTISETPDSLVAAGHSEKKPPIAEPSPMDKYLSDNSEGRYTDFVLKSSGGVQSSQHTDCKGKSSR